MPTQTTRLLRCHQFYAFGTVLGQHGAELLIRRFCTLGPTWKGVRRKRFLEVSCS
jgi:hypothetical protein